MKFFFRPRPPAAAHRAADSQHIQISNPWHAVEVRSSRAACPACRALAGRRFLSHEAPPLPVAGCTQPKVCRNVYQHFDDRREGPRRAAEQIYPGLQPPPPGNERRLARGRRSTDGYR